MVDIIVSISLIALWCIAYLTVKLYNERSERFAKRYRQALAYQLALSKQPVRIAAMELAQEHIKRMNKTIATLT